MGTILGAWQLVYIFAAVPCGLLLDRLGARRAVALGTLVIALSALGRSLATSYVELLVAVMIFGVGPARSSRGGAQGRDRALRSESRGSRWASTRRGRPWAASSPWAHPLVLLLRSPATGVGSSCCGAASRWPPPRSGGWRRESGCRTTPLRIATAVTMAGRTRSRDSSLCWGRFRDFPGVPILLAMAVAVFAYTHGLNAWLPELLRRGGLGLVEAGYWASFPTLVGIAASLVIRAWRPHPVGIRCSSR